jgi:hypothetical protein
LRERQSAGAALRAGFGKGAGAKLRRQSQCALNFDRQDQSLEQTGRVEVILAGFVDDPYEVVCLGIGVAQNRIQLSDLKRSGISPISEAYRETLGLGTPGLHD